jgi:hypothetical protein
MKSVYLVCCDPCMLKSKCNNAVYTVYFKMPERRPIIVLEEVEVVDRCTCIVGMVGRKVEVVD